jgi:hypothetical protein
MFCVGRLASLSRGGPIYGLTWRAFGSGIWFGGERCLVVVPGPKNAYGSRVEPLDEVSVHSHLNLTGSGEGSDSGQKQFDVVKIDRRRLYLLSFS